MDTDAVLDAIRRRRTIRRYTSQEVSEDQVRKLLIAAMSAPSTMNRRPWHFLVIRDPEQKKRIAQRLRLHTYVEQAPVLIAVLADAAASPTWRLDLSAAVENMHLEATAMGLGSAWIGSPDLEVAIATQQDMHQTLGVPANLKLFAFVSAGYPAEERSPHEFDEYFALTRVHYDHWNVRVARGE